MGKTQDARRSELVINYNGKDISTDLAKHLTDFTYNDAAAGTIDSIQINLEDRDRKWQGPWSPTEGDKIKAEIKTINWNKPGEVKKLPLGVFEVDSFDLAGPPDTATIKALALPAGSNVRQEKRSKAWENVSLKTIAAEVAKKAKLKLIYEASINPNYERLDQSDVSDMTFLGEQTIKEGIALKVAGGNLVLFDEAQYEKKPSITTLERDKDNILSYSFAWGTANSAYSACEVSYTDGAKKKTVKAVYKPPNAPSGPVLKINERVDSQAEALRKAKNSLRNKNKEAGKASFTLMGDVRIATGVTLNIKGFGRFDGKYIIESCSHVINGSGYVTTIDIRKVLGW